MSTSSLSAPRDRISGRATSQRMLTVQRGRGRQDVFVVETGRFDLHVATERPLSISETVEFELETGFPAEVKKWRGIVHWTFANRKNQRSRNCPDVSRPSGTSDCFFKFDAVECAISIPDPGNVISLKDGRRLSGKSVNYSRNGILLQTSAEFQVGDRISFEWYSIRSQLLTQQRRSIDAVVRWASKEMDAWLIGCETPKDTIWSLSDADICRKLRTADPRDASF